jgi:hypothetical protein
METTIVGRPKDEAYIPLLVLGPRELYTLPLCCKGTVCIECLNLEPFAATAIQAISGSE